MDSFNLVCSVGFKLEPVLLITPTAPKNNALFKCGTRIIISLHLPIICSNSRVTCSKINHVRVKIQGSGCYTLFSFVLTLKSCSPSQKHFVSTVCGPRSTFFPITVYIFLENFKSQKILV